MNVTYTPEEVQAALQLYDMAVKYGGLNVAEIAIVLSRKLTQPKEETNG